MMSDKVSEYLESGVFDTDSYLAIRLFFLVLYIPWKVTSWPFKVIFKGMT